MVIPKEGNIPMPPPRGGTPPVITRASKPEGGPGEIFTVQFTGEIGGVSQYTELITLLDSVGSDDVVEIMIDTPGGDVYTTMHLAGRIETCKAKVITVASGLVASAGTFLWFYGHEKRVDRWARFMFHSSLHGDWGKSLAIKETATELVKYMASILTDQMKAGVLLGVELSKILNNKADVELSGATVRNRIAKLVDEAGTKEGDDNQNEGSDDNEGATVEGKKDAKKKTTKKRKGEEGEEVCTKCGNNPCTCGEEGGEDDGSMSDMLDEIFEQNGIPNQENADGEENQDNGKPTVEGKKGAKKKSKKPAGEEGEEGSEGGDDNSEGEEGDEGNDGDPEAKKGKKKAKKRKGEDEEEGSESAEEQEEQSSEEEESGEEENSGEEGEEGADDPEAKKKKAKKRKGEATVPNQENADGEENKENGVPEKTMESLFDDILAENGVEAPAEEGGDDDDGDDDDGAEEGDDGAPEGKCGSTRKKTKKTKKRRGFGSGEGDDGSGEKVIKTTEENAAEQGSNVRKAPASRYW